MRPLVTYSFHTAELPPTPQRDRRMPAVLWAEAPPELLGLGDDLDLAPDVEVVAYIRRIGRWLLWRVGPATGGDARYMAIDADRLGRQCTFRLYADGHGHGVGPDAIDHDRFRSWKESLRDDQVRRDDQVPRDNQVPTG